MKKFSNKILLIAFVVLGGIFALSRIYRSPSLESNIDSELLAVDTSAVDEVRIRLADSTQEELKLVKEQGKWMIESGGRKASADKGSVLSMLGVLKELKPDRMVSRKEDKWDSYEVGSGGTQVLAFANGKKVADVKIGKTGFNQSQARGPYGGGGSPYTYVRLTDESDVYAVDGFLVSHFNRKFNDWRNKIFMKINKSEINKVNFNYPDSAFVLEKQDSVWKIGSTIVENSKVDSYLNKLQFKSLSEFADDFVQAAPAPLVVQFHGAAGPVATMRAWREGDDWIVGSSLQEGVYFKGGSAIKDVFVGKSAFTN